MLVFLAQGAAGFFKQLHHPFPVNCRFPAIHPQDEVLVLQSSELGQFVSQLHQVVRHDIVAVSLEGRFGQLPAFLFLAKPQQVLTKLSDGWLVFRIGNQGAALEGRALDETILLRELAADEVVDLGIGRPPAQGDAAAKPMTLGVAFQVGQYTQPGPS